MSTIDRKMLEVYAQDKIAEVSKLIAPLQAELDKWKSFLYNVQNEDVLVLGAGGSPTDLPVERAPVPSPIPPSEQKIGWAEPIRNYFESHKRMFIPASQVAGAVLKELKIDKKLYNTMKPKIYSQLATFDKQKKCTTEKRGNKVYYKWTAS